VNQMDDVKFAGKLGKTIVSCGPKMDDFKAEILSELNPKYGVKRAMQVPKSRREEYLVEFNEIAKRYQ
jgi:hypothetical protein